MLPRLILVLAVVFFAESTQCAPDVVVEKALSSAADPEHELAGQPLMDAMRGGGFTLYFRHTSTDFSKQDGNNYTALKRLLTKPVESRTTNRMVVGHGTPFRAIAGPPHLAEGEAAVLKPLGERVVIVARITIRDWTALLDIAANPGTNR